MKTDLTQSLVGAAVLGADFMLNKILIKLYNSLQACEMKFMVYPGNYSNLIAEAFKEFPDW